MAYRDREARSGGSGFGSVMLFLSGVACGLLFAAKPGKDTREDIADWWNRNQEKRAQLLNKGKKMLGKDEKEAMASEGGKEPFYESGRYT